MRFHVLYQCEAVVVCDEFGNIESCHIDTPEPVTTDGEANVLAVSGVESPRHVSVELANAILEAVENQTDWPGWEVGS